MLFLCTPLSLHWQRQVDDVLLLTDDTLYLALLSGGGVLVQTEDIVLTPTY